MILVNYRNPIIFLSGTSHFHILFTLLKIFSQLCVMPQVLAGTGIVITIIVTNDIM